MNNEEILKNEIVEWLRKKFKIKKYPDEVQKYCNECDLHSALRVDELEGFKHIQINSKKLGITEPFHRASLIGYNTDNGLKWFIVDPTYGQFFHEKNNEEEDNIKNRIFKNYMFSNYPDFSNKLLEQGYIECTIPNMLSYINGFALSNAFTNDIDINEVYQKTEELLLSNNIVDKELHDNYQKLVNLLYLRQQLITPPDPPPQPSNKNNTL